jgi:hypothetical protein
MQTVHCDFCHEPRTDSRRIFVSKAGPTICIRCLGSVLVRMLTEPPFVPGLPPYDARRLAPPPFGKPRQIRHTDTGVDGAIAHGWHFDELLLELLHREAASECKQCAPGGDCRHNAARSFLQLMSLREAAAERLARMPNADLPPPFEFDGGED